MIYYASNENIADKWTKHEPLSPKLIISYLLYAILFNVLILAPIETEVPNT